MSTARLTVVDNTYHQSDDGLDPTGLVHRYSRVVKDSDQVYGPRMVTVGGDWKAIDPGWIKGPALAILENREGMSYPVNPTLEERANAKQRSVVIGFTCDECEDGVADGPVVQPGEHVKFQVKSVETLRLRCEHQEARVLIHLVPL